MNETLTMMQQLSEKAKNYPIEIVARSFGYNFKGTGKYRSSTDVAGLVLFTNTNTYFDYYSHKGGTVIDFVMHEKGLNFKEALNYINEEFLTKDIDGAIVKTGKETNTGFNRKEADASFSLPERNDNHRRAYMYLTKSRGINGQLVQELLHKKLIYESKDKHNVVFVGTDKNFKPRHAFIRGTLTDVQFRGDVSGSNKDYGFSISGNSKRLIVFEAPIDLLSYKSLYPKAKDHLLAIGMLEKRPIDKYLEEHPDIDEISFLLDNDSKGKEYEKFLQDYYKKEYEVVAHPLADKIIASGAKDVNEYLIKRIEAPRQVKTL